MFMILVALIVAAVMAGVLIARGDEWFFSGLIGFLLVIATGVASLGYAYAGWEWIASEHKTAIINREYNTNYTREEVFFASDVIETIREIDRNRVEVNGDVMRGSER